jgi:hypothetical protein
VEEVARTLAIACVLDQRNGWLEQERQQARLVEMQQQDLMDNLLHQFRNSLTTLQTFGKLILRRLLPGDANREIAENMSWEAERLRDLAQQLEQAVGIWEDTNLASLKDAGELPGILPQDTLKDEGAGAKPMPMLPAGLGLESSLTLQRCLVEMILEPLLASAAAIAQDKGLTIYHSIPEDLPPVWANPQALREVLNNLVENAIKYTPAGGQVVVQAIAPDPSSWLEISVSDTGPGIPPEDLPHLFERHYRGVQAQGAIPGSGLGLAIARTLMEQMHGKIQGFSPALAEKLNIPGYSSRPTQGLGTTFLVKLPVAME